MKSNEWIKKHILSIVVCINMYIIQTHTTQTRFILPSSLDGNRRSGLHSCILVLELPQRWGHPPNCCLGHATVLAAECQPLFCRDSMLLLSWSLLIFVDLSDYRFFLQFRLNSYNSSQKKVAAYHKFICQNADVWLKKHTTKSDRSAVFGDRFPKVESIKQSTGRWIKPSENDDDFGEGLFLGDPPS